MISPALSAMLIFCSVSLSLVQGMASFLHLHREVETYASASFITTLGCPECDVEKNVEGRFVAAVLPHSCENACRHGLLHSRHKKSFSSPGKSASADPC